MLPKGSDSGCNRRCGTQQMLLDNPVWPVHHKNRHLGGEKNTPIQFETPPRSLMSSHFISPLWKTWFPPLFPFYCPHTSFIDLGDTGWLCSWEWAEVYPSLSRNPASAAVMFQPSSDWQDLHGKRIIWGFTSKVPTGGVEFHPLNSFGKQDLFKNSVCKNSVPTPAPLTYF